VVHAREDELTSMRSANFLVEKIGGARARMVILEDSYHMICVDNDREIVAKNVLEFFGAAMLSGMSYRHFRIAHVFGHHRSAATDEDPASARLGENVYRFMVRSIAGQLRDAWRIEQLRLAATGKSWYRHRLLGDAAVMAFVYLAILLTAGASGVILFAAQSAVGIVVLEVFNYIAHYGLKRIFGSHGYEPFGAAHSWNSSNSFANALISTWAIIRGITRGPWRNIRLSGTTMPPQSCRWAMPRAFFWR
jgi:hypothetical protein